MMGRTTMLAASALSLASAACSRPSSNPALDAAPPDASSAAVQPQTAPTDVARLSDVLARGASGQETTTGVAALFAAQKLDGFEVTNVQPQILGREDGTLKFKNRTIPAGVLKASFDFSNQKEGEKRTVCTYLAGGYDAEFTTWRSLRTFSCTATDAWKPIAAWKAEVEFVVGSKSGEGIPAAPLGTAVVETVAKKLMLPNDLVGDPEGVAWVTYSEGWHDAKLWVADGVSAPRTLVTMEKLEHPALTTDAIVVSGTGKDGVSQLLLINRKTGDQRVLAAAQDDIRAITVSDGVAYWTSTKDSSSGNSQLFRLSLQGESEKALLVARLPLQATRIVVDHDMVRLSGVLPKRGAPDACMYAEVPTKAGGGAAATGKEIEGFCYQLAESGDLLFGSASGVVNSSPKKGTGKPSIVASCSGWLIRDGALYCAGKRGVTAQALGDSAVKVFADETKAAEIAVSGGYLYWLVPSGNYDSDGGIFRVRLP